MRERKEDDGSPKDSLGAESPAVVVWLLLVIAASLTGLALAFCSMF